MKVGFAGLGIMGWPMAQHLQRASGAFTVWTRDAEKLRRFAHDNGANTAESPRELAAACEVVFLCVGNTAMSRECVLGDQGILHGAAPGTVVVDCSTIAPSVSKQMARELSRGGVSLVDAPCTGSKAGAENGTLLFMVGTDPDLLERVRPLLLSMGNRIYHCGPQGMGLHAKVTQNLILGNLMQAFNEGLVLSTKAGVNPEVMLQILNNSGAQSALVTAKAPAVFQRNFVPTFSLKWLEKDLSLALDTGAELDVPLPATSISRQMLRAAIAQGWGEEDICGSIRTLESIAGCTVTT